MGTYCSLAVPTAAAPLLGSAVRDFFFSRSIAFAL